jgi:hypothetical protein
MTGSKTIERRYSARHPIELAVQVLYRGRRFLGARGRNLSSQGLYLEMRHVTLPVGTLVELEMDCLGREWLVEAVVVHHGRTGAGFMFREPQPALYAGLTRLGPAMPPPRGLDQERPRVPRA